MSVIFWDASLMNHVEIIDEQHQQLVVLLNAFYDASQKRQEEAMQILFDGLADYARYHFGTEENLMRESGYASSPQHLIEHRKFVENVTDWQKQLAEYQYVSAMEVTEYLKSWLLHHIAQSDKGFCKFLNAKGIK